MTVTRSSQSNLIVITGAGGFIGGHLTKYFRDKGLTRIRAVDNKPLDQWHQRVPDIENVVLDCSQAENCRFVCQNASEVYNLATDMGGIGFIERFRVDCLRGILINTNMIEAAYRAGVQRYFFSSSACVYNVAIQQDPHGRPLKEADAYPALAERGYGWEKLISEIFCEEYWAERGLRTFVARLHNVYGPFGTWDGGREKAPADICRKVIEAIDHQRGGLEIWGDGHQTRSFMYIADCVKGIDLITHCDQLVARPINLGSSELISIDGLLEKVERIAGVRLSRNYNLSAPRGVAGRNSDNTMINQILSWEPDTPLDTGLEETYHWISAQYYRRKRGERDRE